MTLFVDTSVFYAASDAGDVEHQKAIKLLKEDDHLVITDFILAECWLLISRKLSFSAAEQFWFHIKSGLAEVETIMPGDLEVAWQIGQRFADQTFSLVDRVSFAVMERKGLSKVASFDSDFAIYRYGLGSKKAFDVLG